MATPSKLRREGEEAFFSGGNPSEECPYINPFNRSNWIQGWFMELANYQYQKELEKQEERNSDWIRNMIKEADDLNELKEAILNFYDNQKRS